MPNLPLDHLLKTPTIRIRQAARHESCLEISHITLDSRECSAHSVFVALKGQNVDGRRFIKRTPAPIILVQEWTAEWQHETAALNKWILQVDDARQVMADWACWLSDYPARKMTMIGITGTNGKTTTTWMLAHILQQSGLGPVGTIGTIGHRIDGVPLPKSTGFTTPELPGLQRSLMEFVQQGCRVCIMEVSSIGLMMKRVGGIQFDIAAFSNFTQDHLDVHGSMTEYLMEKRTLFQHHVSADSISLLMADHPAVAETPVALGHTAYLSCNTSPACDWWVSNKSFSVSGTDFICHHGQTQYPIHLPLIGEHNIENALIAIASAIHVGASWEQVMAALQTLPQTPGRLEHVTGDFHGHAFVDYAHTPDALKQSLTSLRNLCEGKLWVVFGCGGDRDRAKRPLMGAIAMEYADYVVITSDNPRTESPMVIIDDICNGIPTTADSAPIILSDRQEAIQYALANTEANDIILVAGKGHENYQIIGTTKHHFDDGEIIRTFQRSNPLP